ncbi:MAG: TetR/AcrR family transcriptional regulator C-terminal ligand-binding domain-containing protein [Streptosporangiaceae bacterium]
MTLALMNSATGIAARMRISAEVMETILKRAADRGEARAGAATRIATLPTALFRNELFLARTPPSEGTLVEIVDDVFLPLVRPRPEQGRA